MMQNNLHLVIGLGVTGLSCLRFLVSKNIPVMVADTRENPPQLIACQKEFPEIKIFLGKFQADLFAQAQTLVVSPGVSLDEPCILHCIQNNIPVIGDVELFVRDAKAPIVAITGSNGKSTLTTVVGECINHSGKKAIVCGNIGRPVLDVFNEPTPDYYVIELSSFQLDTTVSLKAKVAVVINVSPDHLDRYGRFENYLASKQRIYKHCENAVVNRDEKNIWENLYFEKPAVVFTLEKPMENQFGLKDDFLACGDDPLISISTLLLQQRHNNQNYLAALAIGFVLQLPIKSMLETLRTFAGLSHRCQRVKSNDAIAWYNDSKGTNIGASIAAIESMGQTTARKIILLAGGDSKGVDLTPLKIPVKQYVSCVILFGQDAALLQNTLQDCAEIVRVMNMHEAVGYAKKIARPGDIVLLSPACSSLDQYQNYAARGDDFMQEVLKR